MRLKELIARCKCSVEILINPHRSEYMTAAEWCADRNSRRQNEIDAEIVAEMVAADFIVVVHAYPDTPVGSVVNYSADLDDAIEAALEGCGPPRRE